MMLFRVSRLFLFVVSVLIGVRVGMYAWPNTCVAVGVSVSLRML